MMKKILFVVAGLAVGAGLIALLHPRSSRAQVEENRPQTTSPTTTANDFEEQDPNEDIKVIPQVGEWMVCVASYTGPKAHAMARKMVAELRGPQYKLPAYVFNHGAEKRRQERERVEALRQKQIALLKEFGQKGPVKIRIKRLNYEEQVAVLIGGYREKDTAKDALKELKQLEAPNPKRVQMDWTFILHKDKKTGAVEGQKAWVNPFTHGFIVRNPSFPKRSSTVDRSAELEALKALNAGEPFSLLRCPKQFTLAVKEFRMPAILQQEKAPQSILGRLNLVSSTPIKQDQAGESAHNLAAFLREQLNLDAYVLHNRDYSLVTIGATRAKTTLASVWLNNGWPDNWLN